MFAFLWWHSIKIQKVLNSYVSKKKTNFKTKSKLIDEMELKFIGTYSSATKGH